MNVMNASAGRGQMTLYLPRARSAGLEPEAGAASAGEVRQSHHGLGPKPWHVRRAGT